MKEPHVLLIGKNVAELRNQLADIFSAKSLRDFDAEVKKNVVQLFELGHLHFQFAVGLRHTEWRQIVSRAYYGAYGVSRSVRLAVKGHYSRESKDHDKISDLPDDLPNRNTYINRLTLLRDDRNLCDYDHTTNISDLAASIPETLSLVAAFIDDSKAYLRLRNIRV